MKKNLRKFLTAVIRDMGKKYLDQELDNLILLGKIQPDDKDKIIKKVEFTSLSSNIEVICAKYRGIPTPKTKGDILASEFSVMFEVEDALEDWNTKYLQPIINSVVEEEKRG